LHKGAAVSTDVRIPTFGAASAGKTHLLMAGIVELYRTAQTKGMAPGFLDDSSRTTFEEYQRLVVAGQSPAKTAASTPVAATLGLRSKKRTYLLHFFDAAGEALVDPAHNAELAYLDEARTLIFVLDPFSIADVRNEATGPLADVLQTANAATFDPEESYHKTVSRLRLHSVDTGKQRLAFVISKADLLDRLPLGQALLADPGQASEWLVKVGLDNLVTAAGRDFAEVRYFVVAATDGESAAKPFRWLLEDERLVF
jgi:hypothetical protein